LGVQVRGAVSQWVGVRGAEVARRGSEPKDAHPPRIPGGAHEMCRPAGSDARTPRQSGGGRDLCHFARRTGGRRARRASKDRRVRHAWRSRRIGRHEGQISDRFTRKTAHSRPQKARLGCSPTGGWETTRPPKMTRPLGRFPGGQAGEQPGRCFGCLHWVVPQLDLRGSAQHSSFAGLVGRCSY